MIEITRGHVILFLDVRLYSGNFVNIQNKFVQHVSNYEIVLFIFEQKQRYIT
jgi:hypothetical protein